MADRGRVFLDVDIDGSPAGRLVVELFNDKTPKTCENFRALCHGSHKGLSYTASPFHRIIDEFMIQGGDITKGDGTGGASIYSGDFEDENLDWRDIDAAGLVCMANRGPGTNSSQFFITLEPTPHLNGKHTVFGRLVAGQDVLDTIAKVPVDKDDKPRIPVLIARCGVLRRPLPGLDPMSDNDAEGQVIVTPDLTGLLQGIDVAKSAAQATTHDSESPTIRATKTRVEDRRHVPDLVHVRVILVKSAQDDIAHTRVHRGEEIVACKAAVEVGVTVETADNVTSRKMDGEGVEARATTNLKLDSISMIAKTRTNAVVTGAGTGLGTADTLATATGIAIEVAAGSEIGGSEVMIVSGMIDGQ